MNLKNKELSRNGSLAFEANDKDAGAPDEIVITPAMVKAVVGVLLAIDTRLETYEDVAKELIETVFKNNLQGRAYRLTFYLHKLTIQSMQRRNESDGYERYCYPTGRCLQTYS